MHADISRVACVLNFSFLTFAFGGLCCDEYDAAFSLSFFGFSAGWMPPAAACRLRCPLLPPQRCGVAREVCSCVVPPRRGNNQPRGLVINFAVVCFCDEQCKVGGFGRGGPGWISLSCVHSHDAPACPGGMAGPADLLAGYGRWFLRRRFGRLLRFRGGSSLRRKRKNATSCCRRALGPRGGDLCGRGLRRGHWFFIRNSFFWTRCGASSCVTSWARLFFGLGFWGSGRLGRRGCRGHLTRDISIFTGFLADVSIFVVFVLVPDNEKEAHMVQLILW